MNVHISHLFLTLTYYILYRLHMEAVRDDMRADNFFASSQMILKSAFHRFISNIQYQRRIRTTVTYIQSNRHTRKRLISSMFLKWRQKFGFQLLCSCYRQNRNNQLLTISFAKWRMSLEVEKLYKLSINKRMLASIFNKWKYAVSNQIHRRNDDNMVVIIQNKLLLRRIFLLWKKTSDIYSAKYDDNNNNHYHINNQSLCNQIILKQNRCKLKRIFSNWYTSHISKAKASKFQSNQVSPIHRKYIFYYWYKLCQSIWSNRGQLLKQFYINLRKQIQLHKQAEYNNKMASLFHSQYKCYKFIHLLKARINHRTYLRSKLATSENDKTIAYIHSTIAIATAATNNITRNQMHIINTQLIQIKEYFTKWIQFIFFQRHNQSSIQSSYIYNQKYTIHKLLKRWYNYIHFNRHALTYVNQYLLTSYLRQWQSMIPSIKSNRIQNMKSIQIYDMRRVKYVKGLFQSWYQNSKQQKRLNHIYKFIKYKHDTLYIVRIVFNIWHQKYSQNMVKKFNYLEAENKDVYMLSHLKVLELQDLEITLHQVRR